PLTGDWSCFDAPALLLRISEEEGRPLKLGEADRILAQRAWKKTRDHPWKAIRLAGWKALLFWAPGEISNNGVESIERETSPVLSRMPIRFAPLFGLSLIGFWILARQRPIAATPVVLTVIVYFASFIPFVLAGQYRTPLIPLLAVGAGVTLTRMVACFRNRQRRALAGYLVAASFCIGLAYANPTDLPPDRAQWHFMLGQMFARSGEPDMEEIEYRKALDVDPQRPEVWQNLGILLFEQSRIPEAATALSRAIHLRETALSHLYLGRIHVVLGQPRSALPHLRAAELMDPRRADPPYRLGLAEMELGEPENAILSFRRALRNDAHFSAARFGLGWALREAGDPENALREFESLRNQPPVDSAVLYQGGLALQALHREAEAMEWWTSYLDLAPTDEEIRTQVDIWNENRR
ncbi:MAG: tetratricopeptide repeat protein, partial [Kiritimatiellia bacterium]|nr:tetratricopeptide repeat protein [Kiritimatiellia bacterium]